jgi:cell division protein FtsI (penicillin-binding protein 3)
MTLDAPDANAAPHGRPIGRGPDSAGPRTALIRVDQPELARRAVLASMRWRLGLAGAGFALMFGLVGLRLAQVTLLNPEATPRLATPARHATPPAEPLPARARITDRNGEVLAVNLRITELAANPSVITDPVGAAARLAHVLPQLDEERLARRLTGTGQFTYLLRSVTPREQQAVLALGIPGIEFRTAERRIYPQGRTAAHILGGVDVDGFGLAGIESYFNEVLTRRRGEALRLSIDIRVQMALSEAVQHAITDYNGIGGAGILMDVTSGELLGMVSLPDFDLSEPQRTDTRSLTGDAAAQNPRFNRPVVGVYEPGSTFKLLTSAMALEYGTVTLSGGYDASRPIRQGRFTISDFRGKNRWLSVPEIIAHSSNIASAHMAAAVGPQRHRDFMTRMGMGARLGVELPEAARPNMQSPQSWGQLSTMTVGFGHGIAVTPLHVVTGVAALANGGILRQPTLLARDPGHVAEGPRVVSERTSDTMRRLMRLVVTDGSGRSADVPGYFVGGKTGTAEKSGGGARGYSQTRRIAAFVGAFPIQAPRYALYVMVDEPKPNARSHGYATAGWVAAPAAGMVVRQVAPVLGLVPEAERIAEIQAGLALTMQGGRPARPAPAPGSAPVTATPPARPGPPPSSTPTPPRPSQATAPAPLREARLAPQ